MKLVQAFMLALLVGYILFMSLFTVWQEHSTDWFNMFQPVGERALSGDLRFYGDTGFYNPPYAVLLIAPLSALDPLTGSALWTAIMFASYFTFAVGLKFKPASAFFFLVSGPVVLSLWWGNLDGLIFLGAVISPFLGIPLLLLKPQVGIGLILYYTIHYFAEPGIDRETLIGFEAAAIIGLCILIAPGMIASFNSVSNVNLSLLRHGFILAFLSIWVGGALTVSGVATRNKALALAASPFFAPYVAFNSLAGLLAPLGKRPLYMGALSVLSWVVVIAMYYPPTLPQVF